MDESDESGGGLSVSIELSVCISMDMQAFVYKFHILLGIKFKLLD